MFYPVTDKKIKLLHLMPVAIPKTGYLSGLKDDTGLRTLVWSRCFFLNFSFLLFCSNEATLKPYKELFLPEYGSTGSAPGRF